MKKSILVIFVIVLALIGLNWAIELKTQQRIDKIKQQLFKIAPIGKLKTEVERGFENQGLEHVFGVSDNAIYGGEDVGRYRLFYSTVLTYKVLFDSSDRVAEVKTHIFNDGL